MPTIHNLIPPTEDFQWPLLPIDPDALVKATLACVQAGVTYGLGAKAPTLSAVPGHDFKKIDCSGFVRWAIFQASNHQAIITDGSVNQHDQIQAAGFKPSTVDDANDKDEHIRIAFLEPHDAPDDIGHVVLIYKGVTCESYGHHGPDRRVWGSRPWMQKMHVYVLT